jgi:ATP-binding cassette subfamily F protein 3
LWLVHDGHARAYDGDLSDYRGLVLSADRPDGKGKIGAPVSQSGLPPVAKKGPSASTLRSRLADAEKAIAKEQQVLETIDARMASPSFYAEGAKAVADLTKKREFHAAALAKAEAAWVEASEALEAVGV